MRSILKTLVEKNFAKRTKDASLDLFIQVIVFLSKAVIDEPFYTWA